MNKIVDITTIIYNIIIIILSTAAAIIAYYTLKNQKKSPSITARVNYNFNEIYIIPDKGIPITIDLINSGDLIAKNINIELKDIRGVILFEDYIEFIKSNEIFRYCIGHLKENKIHWIFNNNVTDIENTIQPGLFKIEYNTQKTDNNMKITIIFNDKITK